MKQSMSKRGKELYLEDIYHASSKILQYIKGYSLKDFKKDQKTIDAVLRNLEIIGEASSRLRKDFKSFCEKVDDVSWNEMAGLRNIVAHEYFGIDLEIIWKSIEEDIPHLKKAIKKHL